MKTTKAQALREFRQIGGVVRGDVIATRESWNNFVDDLNKSGWVTDSQAYNWSNPF